MSNPWPSPLPGPAWHSYRVAWDWVISRTLRGVPDAVQYAILRSPAVEAAHEAMCIAADAGEVALVRRIAEQWRLLVKQARAAQTKEAA